VKKERFLFLAVFMTKFARDANSDGKWCGAEAVPVMSRLAPTAWSLRTAKVPKTPRRVHVVAASGGHRYMRKGLEGRVAAAQAAEPPQSPVFGAAENAPK
jgi:hypothetical protein